MLAPKKLHPDVCCLFATVLVQHSTAQYQNMEELIRRSALVCPLTRATITRVVSKNTLREPWADDDCSGPLAGDFPIPITR